LGSLFDLQAARDRQGYLLLFFAFVALVPLSMEPSVCFRLWAGFLLAHFHAIVLDKPSEDFMKAIADMILPCLLLGIAFFPDGRRTIGVTCTILHRMRSNWCHLPGIAQGYC